MLILVMCIQLRRKLTWSIYSELQNKVKEFSVSNTVCTLYPPSLSALYSNRHYVFFRLLEGELLRIRACLQV